MPQTPQASEHVGAVAAIQSLSKPTVLVGDCLWVVRSVNKLKSMFVPDGAYAGVLFDVNNAEKLQNVQDCLWTPSHTLLDMNADAKTRLFHSSNDVVDEAAKQHRREIEDEIDGDLLKDAEADCKIATSVLRALGDILAGWPALPRGVERQQEARLGRLGIKHDWRWNHTLKLWRCRACCRFSHITVDEGPPANCGACKPGRAFEREMRAYDLGHDLVACTRANAPMTLCRKCGAHGSWRWQKLLDPCPSTPPATQVQEWLRKTLKTGQAPYQLSTRQAQSHGAAQPAKHSKRRKPRKKIPVTPKGLDALRNKLHATEADKANWNPRLCYGAGPETAPKPDRKERPVTTDLNLDNPVHGEQDGAHRRSPDAQPVQNVRPSPKADASNEDALDQAMPEVECDVCLATLLETDHACAACGWRRPYKVATLTPVGVQSARITAPPEMPTILSPSATTAETERQDQAESEPQVARATTTLPWHGGTLTPPPACLTEAANAPGPSTQVGPSKPRKISGYRIWTRLNGDRIRSEAACSGMKAFGAAAGRLWKSLDDSEREAFNKMAAEQHRATNVASPEPPEAGACLDQQTREPQPQPAEPLKDTDPPRSTSSHAKGPTTGQLRPLPVAQNVETATRKSGLDESDGEFGFPEPGAREGGEPELRKSRLEAVRERILNRIRARACPTG